MLHSTLAPEHSLTAFDGAAPTHGLAIALLWWPVSLALALTYGAVVLRHERGPDLSGSAIRFKRETMAPKSPPAATRPAAPACRPS